MDSLLAFIVEALWLTAVPRKVWAVLFGIVIVVCTIAICANMMQPDY